MTALAINAVLFVLAAGAGLLWFRLVVRNAPETTLKTIHTRLPFLLPTLVTVGTSAGVLIVVNMRFELAWLIPARLQLATTALIWILVVPLLGFVLAIGNAAAFRDRHVERWKLLIACVGVVGVIGFQQWRNLWPIAPQLCAWVVPGGMVNQTSAYSCAPAAAANIVQRFGMVKSEQEMAELFGTTAAGSSWAQIMQGLDKLGLQCRKVHLEDADPAKLQPPAILFVDHPAAGRNSHAVAVMDCGSEGIDVWDPLDGRMLMTTDRLRSIWHGYAIEVGGRM